MQAAGSPFVIPGVVLAGASLIAVSPLTPPTDVPGVTTAAVRLVDTSDAIGSVANIPENLFNDLASVPYNEIQGLNELSADLEYTNNWFLYDPTNVLGIDEADPGKAEALADLLVPFPAFSHYDYPIFAQGTEDYPFNPPDPAGPAGAFVGPTDVSTVEGLAPADQSFGYDLATVAEAELPMNAGCTGLPGPCPDVDALLSNMFNLNALSQLTSPQGYTFPTVVDPVDTDGGMYPTGVPMPWSDQHISLDPSAPYENFYNSLLQDPTDNAIKTLTPTDVSDALTAFGHGLNTDFDPFVQGSYIFDPAASGLAFVTLPLSPILCPNCGTDPLGGEFPVPHPLPDVGLPLSLTQPSPGVYDALFELRNLVAADVGLPPAPLPYPDAVGTDTSSFDNLLGSIFGDSGSAASTGLGSLGDLSQFTSALSGADLNELFNPATLDPTMLADLSQFFDASPFIDVAQAALSALVP